METKAPDRTIMASRFKAECLAMLDQVDVAEDDEDYYSTGERWYAERGIL